MANLLVSTVKTQFGLRKKDISDVSDATFIQWSRIVNDFVYRYLIDANPTQYLSTQTFSVTSGTATYALNSDFRDASTFGAGMYKVDDNSNPVDNRLAITGYGGREKGYYFDTTNVVFTPEPTQSETYNLRYIPQNTEITATSQYFTTDGTITGEPIIPEHYLEYIINALDVQYTIWDSTPGDEGLADQRFIRTLNELAAAIAPDGMAYGLPSFSSIY